MIGVKITIDATEALRILERVTSPALPGRRDKNDRYQNYC
jgi:hypothetical protein